MFLLVAGCSGGTGSHPADWIDPQPATLDDLDPDPMVFDAELTARETTWEIAPGVPVDGLAYEGGVPGPLIRAAVGSRVRIHFESDLPRDFDTSIHWHGIEGNNAADGTPVTQTSIPPGGSFDYDFVVTRPGLYWYHPHTRGAQGTFDGLYAPLIVEDPDEAELKEQGVLPAREILLLLSDVSLYEGAPVSVESDDAMLVMNGTEGQHLLVNGREDPVFEIAAGDPVRLRLWNTSITRFWRVAVPDHVLYRIGGEGGLLDAVRVEGGTVRGNEAALSDGSELGETDVPLGYSRGEILLGPADRADVVLVPNGSPGDELELRWEDVARGRHGMWFEGDEMVMDTARDDGLRPGETVATFRLVDGTGVGWDLGEGDPVLGSVGRAVEPIVPGDEALQWTGASAMVLSEDMQSWKDENGVWQMSTDLFIDGASWHADHDGGPRQAEAPTAVHARLGETIVWEIRNESEMSHPVHLHGFSFQPVSFARTDEEAGTVTTWEPGYVEIEDTTIVPGGTSLFVHVRLDDPLGDGSALGRWMRHCHVFQHAEHGMMSELIVGP